jgi:hypothetical protein
MRQLLPADTKGMIKGGEFFSILSEKFGRSKITMYKACPIHPEGFTLDGGYTHWYTKSQLEKAIDHFTWNPRPGSGNHSSDRHKKKKR